MERDMSANTVVAAQLPVSPLHLHIQHPEFGTVAYIVLETGFWRRAVGGVRMLAGITEAQVADLARSMSYKFAFLNMPCTGAKGGIVTSPAWYPDKKAEVLNYIGRSVAQLVQGGLYTPGADLGFGMSDCWAVLRGAGISTPDRDPDVWTDAKSSPGFSTGLSVFVTAEEALVSLGSEIDGASVAIEGFGKVGAAAAKLFSDAGAKVIAVSTAAGAIHSSKGLNIDSLLELRSRHGDDLVLNYDSAESIPLASLLTLDVDILCPCAGQWTLGGHNIENLNCRVISSGSNCSIDPQSRTTLENSDSILVMPDFVASSGTVLAGNLMGSEATIWSVFDNQFRQKVRSLLEHSRTSGQSPVSIAQRIAAENLRWSIDHSTQARRQETLHKLASRIAGYYYMPSRARSAMTMYFAGKWLPSEM